MRETISRQELKAKMDRSDDFVLVDSLSREHFERSHLPGAISLPLEEVENAEKVLPDKSREVVVYCMSESCATSDAEVRVLRELGYERVRHYAAGKQDWIQAGLPVEGRARI